MKSLSFEKMEEYQGGNSTDCGYGVGAAIGVTVGLAALTVITGGVGFAVATFFAFQYSPFYALSRCQTT